MAEITIEQIEKALNDRVRPGLSLHGGGIQVEKLRTECCMSGCSDNAAGVRQLNLQWKIW